MDSLESQYSINTKNKGRKQGGVGSAIGGRLTHDVLRFSDISLHAVVVGRGNKTDNKQVKTIQKQAATA